MKVLQLIDDLEDVFENSSSIPFAGKALIDKGEVLELLKEIRIQLPDEIKQAQWIKEERQRILIESQREADTILHDAKKHIEEMIEKDEITKKAHKRAEDIISQAQVNAKDIRIGARQYADELLSGVEKNLEALTKTVRHNRKELKGMNG